MENNGDIKKGKGMKKGTYRVINHAIKDPLRFGHAIITDRHKEWSEHYSSTGLGTLEDFFGVLEQTNVSKNDNYSDLALATLTFTTLTKAMHTPYHLLKSSVGEFLEGIMLGYDGTEKVTIKDELEKIVEVLKPKVVTSAEKFIDIADEYGWKAERFTWGDIGLNTFHSIGKDGHTEEPNRERDVISEQARRSAMNKIKKYLTWIDTRSSSYFDSETNFDYSSKIHPQLSGESKNIDEVFKRLDNVNLLRMASMISEATEVYHSEIGGSAQATAESKEMLICLSTAQNQLTFMHDLLQFHKEYFRRSKIEGSREYIIKEIYEGKDGKSLTETILMAAYCTDVLVAKANYICATLR